MVPVKHLFSTFDAPSNENYFAGMSDFLPVNLPPAAVPKRQRTRNRDQLTEFRTQIISEAKELGLTGATDFEAAQALGVSERTLNMWKARDPEFAAALRISKDIADGMIEATLYHKARGYSFRSEKIFQHEGQIIRAETIEHVPPSDTAMIFWLKNRQREKWRDQQDHRVDGDVNVSVTVDADPRRLAIAMLATLRKALEAGESVPLTIEGETASEAS
jgi:hypothetical protein